MTLPLSSAPDSVCLLRLSAIGDITHALPVLRTLQHHWPQTNVTWIIGKNEHALLSEIDGVEFIIFDKSLGFRAYREVRHQLAGHRFDVLLHMQVSLRASLTSLFIRAGIKLGFDRARAKDLQWLFTNERIVAASTRQHVVDSFIEFPKRLGLDAVMRWDLPVAEHALDSVQHLVNGDRLLVINPCAVAKSRNWRNWNAEGYAAVADYAAQHHGMTVVLSGGPASLERDMAHAILAICRHKPLDLVGRTSLPQLVALLQLADAVIAPDTGPAHIASALGTPVIGLYAATNPQRAAPYNFKHYVVNRYPEALKKYCELSVDQAPWGKRIHNDECMSLIKPEDVNRMLDRVLRDSDSAQNNFL
ncbi:MAG: glycosyltransferase family 9 protein [Gammaproteobacteria bacterium]|nr:glycosyltransferase family 9 protein [Gammaproteobacteria bacterium]NNJ98178.1 glycosyltransferase family 9 protein [Gammaproteobacteria bacterium]